MTKKLFLIILFWGLLGSLISKDRDFSIYENRYLAKAPALSIQSVADGSFTAQMDLYMNEQFFLRNEWIRMKTLCDKDLLRKKTINGVYLGKSDYLIARYTEKDVSGEQLNRNITYLNSFIEKYKADVILVPTASEILTNKLPAVYSHLNQHSLLTQIPMSFDAAAILQAHSNEDIYYKTDHHWTLLGAYYVYEQYTGSPLPLQTLSVSENFYGTNFKKVNLPNEADTIKILQSPNQFLVTYDNSITQKSLYESAHLATSDQYSYYLDGNHGLTEITNLTAADSAEDSILLIKDSFANTFATLLCNNYRKVYLIDLRYFNESIAAFIQKNQIQKTLFLYNNMNFIQDKNLVKLLH